MNRSVVAEAAALRKLELVVTRRLDGLLGGDYRGLFTGPGTELAEGRPYAPGDDVRRIDWNLSARMAEPYVRTTEPDRELTTWVVVDGSASLDFGTALREKRELALAGCAAVAFLTARGGNRVGGIITGGTTPVVVQPRSGAGGAFALLRKVAETPRQDGVPGDAATIAAALTAVGRVQHRRGLVAVVSDFLEPGWPRALRRVATRHELLALVVGDPRELTLPSVGLLTLVDPETGRRVEVQTASPKLRARYAEAAARQSRERTAALRASGARVVPLSTDRDWVVDLVRHVAASRRRRGGLASGITR